MLDDGYLFVYMMGDSVLVVVNVGSSDVVILVDLLDGNWVCIVDGEVIDVENGVGGILDGGCEVVVVLVGILQIWVWCQWVLLGMGRGFIFFC